MRSGRGGMSSSSPSISGPMSKNWNPAEDKSLAEQRLAELAAVLHKHDDNRDQLQHNTHAQKRGVDVVGRLHDNCISLAASHEVVRCRLLVTACLLIVVGCGNSPFGPTSQVDAKVTATYDKQ